MRLTRMRYGNVPPFTEPVDIRFDERVNVFVGPNATGKSRLLSALVSSAASMNGRWPMMSIQGGRTRHVQQPHKKVLCQTTRIKGHGVHRPNGLSTAIAALFCLGFTQGFGIVYVWRVHTHQQVDVIFKAGFNSSDLVFGLPMLLPTLVNHHRIDTGYREHNERHEQGQNYVCRNSHLAHVATYRNVCEKATWALSPKSAEHETAYGGHHNGVGPGSALSGPTTAESPRAAKYQAQTQIGAYHP